MSSRGLSLLIGLTITLASCWRGGLDAITSPPNSGGGQGGNTGGQGGNTGGNTGGSGGVMTCPTPALGPGDTNQTVIVSAMGRTYVLHVPSSYTGSTAVPLVIDFHAISGTGARERAASPYPAETDPEGVIMAFPNGVMGPDGTAWNVGPCCVAGVDDVAFTRALVAQVRSVACIDPSRIYAVGVSMGGGMAYYLACHAADIFASVAPSAFDLLQENAGDCAPARPITVIAFRGSADTLVPYGGGASSVVPGMPVTFLGAQATFQKWAQLDGCTGAPSAEDANGCATYSSCQGGVQVTLCTKQGGGQDQGDPSIAWPLLKQHPQ